MEAASRQRGGGRRRSSPMKPATTSTTTSSMKTIDAGRPSSSCRAPGTGHEGSCRRPGCGCPCHARRPRPLVLSRKLEYNFDPLCAIFPPPVPALTPAQRATSDDVIRTALRSRLLTEATGHDTVLVEELGLCRGQVRIDVAIVNGLLHAYEIKSDRDNLRRLAKQADFYGRVVDRATIVVGDRLLECASEAVPAWWGVIRARTTPRGVRFTTVRRARKNPDRIPRALAELLWSADAMSLLEARDLARGFRGKPRRMLWDRVCEQYSLGEIASAVRRHLKARAARPGSGSPARDGESYRACATPLPNHAPEPRQPRL